MNKEKSTCSTWGYIHTTDPKLRTDDARQQPHKQNSTKCDNSLIPAEDSQPGQAHTPLLGRANQHPARLLVTFGSTAYYN